MIVLSLRMLLPPAKTRVFKITCKHQNQLFMIILQKKCSKKSDKLQVSPGLHLFLNKQFIFDPRPENCLSFSKKSSQKIV